MAIRVDPPPFTGAIYIGNPVFWELWNGNTEKKAGTLVVFPIGRKTNPKEITGHGVPWDVGPDPAGGRSGGQGVWDLSCTPNALAMPAIAVDSSRSFLRDYKSIKLIVEKLLAIKKPCKDPEDIDKAMGLIVKLNKLTLKRLQISIRPSVAHPMAANETVREGLCGERPTQLTKNLKQIKYIADLIANPSPIPTILASQLRKAKKYYTEHCKWIYLGAYGKSPTGTDKPLIPPSIPHPDDPGLTIIIGKRTTKIKSITGLEGKPYSLKNKKKLFDIPWYVPVPIKLVNPKTGYIK